MKKTSLFLALVLLLSSFLVACSNGNGENKAANNQEANNASEEPAKEAGKDFDLSVGFVTDEGGINDQSFNQGVHEGLLKAEKDLGIKQSYQESKVAADYAKNMDTLLDADNDLIVAAGFKLADDVEKKAKENPDVNFLIVDYAYDDAPDNLTGIVFQAEQPSFLVGYIAGRTTETNKVGFVGGQEGNVISGFDYGYEAGVKYAAKELGKEITVTKQYVGNFSDVPKAKSITQTMFNGGCDVVFHAAGDAGTGVIEAAKEAGKWAIGVDKDQNELAPDNVLTSAMKRADVAIYNILKDMSEGKDFPGGQTITYSLKDGDAVDIAPSSNKNVKPEILEEIPKLKDKIIKEEIKVPYNAETFKEFEKTL